METKVEETTTDTNTSLNTTNESIDEPEEYSEEEVKKAEEFKTQGNEYFKSKYIQTNNALSYHFHKSSYTNIINV